MGFLDYIDERLNKVTPEKKVVKESSEPEKKVVSEEKKPEPKQKTLEEQVDKRIIGLLQISEGIGLPQTSKQQQEITDHVLALLK